MSKSLQTSTIYIYLCLFLVKPEVRLLNRKISQRIGKETILSCSISASPQAYGVWLKGGKAITQRAGLRADVYNDGPHTVTLNLRIIDIKESDFGYYTCEASNELGKDKEGMILYGKSLNIINI